MDVNSKGSFYRRFIEKQNLYTLVSSELNIFTTFWPSVQRTLDEGKEHIKQVM